MVITLLLGELWHGFVAKSCPMWNAIQGGSICRYPNSDVEESKIYIQKEKEERRWQLDLCLENHAWHAPILMKLHGRNELGGRHFKFFHSCMVSLALYRSLALRVANCCYVFKVSVDYSMALMWEWLEEKKMH